MRSAWVRSLAVSSLAVLVMTGSAVAQDSPTAAPAATPAPAPYEPQVGQEGKDVVWVPTPQSLVDRMLDMARVTVDDYLVDLGSGDGRTVITAAKRGVKAHGIEYNPDLVELSKRNATAAGVNDLASFVQGDIFESDFRNATVITLFLLPSLNLKLRPTLLEMKPGTRIVSNSFDMEDWEPDNRIVAPNCNTSYCRALFWIVPAKVEGTWRLPQGELTLQQKFQMLTGTFKSGKNSTPIRNGRMQGDQITFMVGDRVYRGKVDGDKMEGVFATESKWQATRR